jgi:hypothetical protein
MTGSCRDCGRKWTGHSEAHCPSCCAHFSSDRAFDKHLASPQSDASCFDPSTITRKDGSPYFVQVERSHGPVWMVRDDREHPFSATGASPESVRGVA